MREAIAQLEPATNASRDLFMGELSLKEILFDHNRMHNLDLAVTDRDDAKEFMDEIDAVYERYEIEDKSKPILIPRVGRMKDLRVSANPYSIKDYWSMRRFRLGGELLGWVTLSDSLSMLSGGSVGLNITREAGSTAIAGIPFETTIRAIKSEKLTALNVLTAVVENQQKHNLIIRTEE